MVKIFVKPRGQGVEEVKGEGFDVNVLNDINRVRLAKGDSSVGVSVERASISPGFEQHSTLTPKNSETEVAGVKVRASFKK